MNIFYCYFSNSCHNYVIRNGIPAKKIIQNTFFLCWYPQNQLTRWKALVSCFASWENSSSALRRVPI